MLKSFFQCAAVFASFFATLGDATSEVSALDYGKLCGLVTSANSIVDFAFAGGATTVADGEIVTATLTLNDDYHDAPPSSVAINAPGIKCGRTNFEFDRDDPTTFEQEVTCRTDGGSVPSSKDGSLIDFAMVFDYNFDAGDAQMLQILQQTCRKMLFKRQVGDCGRGGGVGDPHLTTLDKVNYDFQKPGVFRLFESRNLQVQIVQEKCTPVVSRGDAAPSCYQGVAVAYAGSVAKFFLQNGKIQLGKGTSSLAWLSVEKLKGQTDGYRVFIASDQSTYVDVTKSQWWVGYDFLNVAIQVSPFFKDASVKGLLGNWNGNPSDDLRDNNKLALLHSMPLDNNLFTCTGMSCASFLQPATIKDEMARGLKNELPLLHQSYAVVDPVAIPLRAFSPVLVPFVKKRRNLRRMDDGGNSQAGGSLAGVVHAPDAGDAAGNVTSMPHVDVTLRAHELCNHVIEQLAICDKYVGNRGFFIDTVCVGDAVLLGDLSVVDSTKLNYLRECRRELDSRIGGNSSSLPEMASMEFDRTSLAFGDLNTCANNCSGQGVCLAAGCKCNEGFTGVKCGVVV